MSALNGSPTLISQGLRTLELCVDNLQPDFLYDHIQPVRTDLIQGLWRTLRSQNDSIAQAAFRVLGKLGGSNRKMIVEPQRLSYNADSVNNLREFNGPTIKVSFTSYQPRVDLSLEKVIETCYSMLKTTGSSGANNSNTNNNTSSSNSNSSTSTASATELFYKKHAFKIIATFVANLIRHKPNKADLNAFFLDYKPSSSTQLTQYLLKHYQFDDKQLRRACEQTLVCLFYASGVKELRSHALSLLDGLVVHLTMISLAHYNHLDEAKLTESLKANVFLSNTAGLF